MSTNNIVALGTAERAYRGYVHGKHKVTLLIEWFKAELEERPKAKEKYAVHSDALLAKHTRSVEHLAREMRASRRAAESTRVA